MLTWGQLAVHSRTVCPVAVKIRPGDEPPCSSPGTSGRFSEMPPPSVFHDDPAVIGVDTDSYDSRTAKRGRAGEIRDSARAAG
jgi:hypothetical protein